MQASPSNPTSSLGFGSLAERKRFKQGLGASVVFRCTPDEKAALLTRAEQARISISMLMREALSLVDARRHRPVPKADPVLLREIGRIGGDLNQVARWLAQASANGQCDHIDALVVATKLASTERAVWALVGAPSASAQQDQLPC